MPRRNGHNENRFGHDFLLPAHGSSLPGRHRSWSEAEGKRVVGFWLGGVGKIRRVWRMLLTRSYTSGAVRNEWGRQKASLQGLPTNRHGAGEFPHFVEVRAQE